MGIGKISQARTKARRAYGRSSASSVSYASWRGASAAFLLLLTTACGSAQHDGTEDRPAAIGQTEQALGSCQSLTFNGTEYLFCGTLASWTSARDDCRARGDYQLARVDTAAEATFIGTHVLSHTWIGANERGAKGAWRWLAQSSDIGDQFWQGAVNGGTVGGLYANWEALQPDNLLDHDCGVIEPVGQWEDKSCGSLFPHVCEHNPKPDANCKSSTFAGHIYWTCSLPRTWQDARNHCKSVVGADLVQIDSKEENDFVSGLIAGPTSIAANDAVQKGKWAWAETGQVFWLGDASGAAQGGAFTSWLSGQPDNAAGADCGRTRPSGGWSDGACTDPLPFVCEGRPAPDPACTFATHNGHEYWFCPASMTWAGARDACRRQNGMDLVRIDDDAENQFVRSHIASRSWLGGSDLFAEGEWRWVDAPFENGDEFWDGNASGVVSNGAYSKWQSGQPDNSGSQDCAAMDANASGSWFDDGCAVSQGFVCESPPDFCPSNPNKRDPGLCGCATSDVDSDQDGTPDCRDGCPHDPLRTSRGQCGCVGEPNPTAAGTACTDGICPAATCDGNGSCGNPNSCRPDPTCTMQNFRGKVYWFCSGLRGWASARDQCRSLPRTQLLQIDDPKENDFVFGKLGLLPTWFGANDRSASGKWRWVGSASDDGVQFWTGTNTGQAIKGLYANWRPDQPFALNACGSIATSDSGQWSTTPCALLDPFVCETCVRKTCADLGAQCGIMPDGCGGTLNCNQQGGGCTGTDVCFKNLGVCSDPAGNKCMQSLQLNRLLPPDVAVRQYLTNVVYCSQADLDPCVGQFVGAVKDDLNHIASLCQQGYVTPAQHNALIVDRERKERHTRANPSLFCQVTNGDADHDLIPDPVDQCPNTPLLTPTLDNGCPSTATVGGPSADALARIRGHQLIGGHEKCIGAATPDIPYRSVVQGLHGGVGLEMDIGRVTNQPAGCPVFYELYLTGLDPDTQKTVSFHLGFTEDEGAIVTVGSIHPVPGKEQVAFSVLPGQRGDRGRLGSYPHPEVLTLIARVVNGDGNASNWTVPTRIGAEPTYP